LPARAPKLNAGPASAIRVITEAFRDVAIPATRGAKFFIEVMRKIWVCIYIPIIHYVHPALRMLLMLNSEAVLVGYGYSRNFA
jgi:hypothetical protein|tara:strand:- start:131 stop:379 length:249 start_codon:yes stop_codon:yes gene_type:complete